MADHSRRRSLDSLKNEARRWLNALRAGDQAACDRLERALPRLSRAPSLRDIQRALAREHGFDGWSALTDAVAAQRAQAERSRSRYEAAAEALLEAYRTGTPEAMERHYRYTWHRRAWPGMRTYVQLDLGKRPPHPGEAVEITIDDARYLVAVEHGFADWDALCRFTATASNKALETAKPVGVARTGSKRPDDIGRARDWDTVVQMLSSNPGAELHANGQMTDAALARIATIGTVRSLQIGGSREVTDEGLRYLAGLPELERLDVSGTSITDRGLEVFRHCPALRSLSLAGTHVTDAGAPHLAGCAELESINLSWTATGDGVVRAMAGKSRLREFHSGAGLTNDGLAAFRYLPRFKTWHGGEAQVAFLTERVLPTHLTLRGSFDDRGVAALRNLDGLFSLDLDDGRLAITPAALYPLIDLPNLGVLGVDATDDSMAAIAAMPKLRALGIQDTVAGDEGFAALGRSRSLEYIWGRRCHNLGNRGFAALANIPTLIGLSVSCLNVGDDAVAALPSFPALRELMPMDIPHEGYRHIARCTNLESLILMYCRDTTDRATEHIAGMRLRYYFNSYTTITDRTPTLLSSMNTLERITLDGCHNLTNAGVASLARLPRLRELRVSGRSLTAAAAEPFPRRVEVFVGG
jgi:hypothetical protein